MYETIKEHNVSNVIAIGIPDSAFQSHSPDAKRRRDLVNQRLEDYASDSNGFVRYFPCPVVYSRDSRNFEPDGLHFSEEGYKFLASQLLKIVKPIFDRS